MKKKSQWCVSAADLTLSLLQGSWSGRLGQDVVCFPGVEGAATPLMTDVALITSSKNFYVNNSEWQVSLHFLK